VRFSASPCVAQCSWSGHPCLLASHRLPGTCRRLLAPVHCNQAPAGAVRVQAAFARSCQVCALPQAVFCKKCHIRRYATFTEQALHNIVWPGSRE